MLRSRAVRLSVATVLIDNHVSVGDRADAAKTTGLSPAPLGHSFAVVGFAAFAWKSVV